MQKGNYYLYQERPGVDLRGQRLPGRSPSYCVLGEINWTLTDAPRGEDPKIFYMKVCLQTEVKESTGEVISSVSDILSAIEHGTSDWVYVDHGKEEHLMLRTTDSDGTSQSCATLTVKAPPFASDHLILELHELAARLVKKYCVDWCAGKEASEVIECLSEETDIVKMPVRESISN